jgi:[citrate (pro-3S)-lyase] ligase
MNPVAAPLLTAGERLEARRLIESQGLTFEDGCDDLVGVYDGGRLVATAGRAGYVLKMFAVDPDCQGGDVLGSLSSALIVLGRWAGHDSFLVFTRPEHASSFEYCQFRLLVATGDVAMLECGGGLERYLGAWRHLRREGVNGAVVLNANPFTRGHQHLVETAAGEVDTLYVFVVREDRSVFPYDVRRKLVEESTAHVRNAVVLDTSRYAVSAATFPSYFLRRHDVKARVQMEVDVRLFGATLAPAFGIVRRFAGDEPYCETTAAYNRAMAAFLPEYGVAFREIARATDGERAISATTVREALAAGDWDLLARLVPPPTLAFLQSSEGAAIAATLRGREAGH